MATIDWALSIVSDKASVLYATNPVLQLGQVGTENDTNLFKVGDGTLAWNDLAYLNVNNQQSVWIGVSSAPGNLLVRSLPDGGMAVPTATFASPQVVIQALNNTSAVDLFDTTEPVKGPAQRLAVLMRYLVDNLGGDFVNIKTSQNPSYAQTVMQRIVALETNGIDITTILKDSITATDSTWSSSKIQVAINQAIATLVGSAGPALDTIYELANAVSENQNLITTISNDLSNTVRFNVAQSLTAPQKAQAQANIGAASADTLGAYTDGAMLAALTAGYTSTTDAVFLPAYC